MARQPAGRPAAAAAFALLADVVQAPGDGIEQANQRRFADSSTKQRICGKGSEGVVADLRVGGRCSPVNEAQVLVGGHDGRVEQHHPDVDAQRRLFVLLAGTVTNPVEKWTRPYHAVLGAVDAFINHLPPGALQRTYKVAVVGAVSDNLLQ